MKSIKFNKTDPKDLTRLLISGAFSVVASFIRPFKRLKNDNRTTVVFYGHTLNGNLKSFFDYLANMDERYQVFFLTLNKQYANRLKSAGINPSKILLGTNLGDVIKAGASDAFVTSHGLHFFSVFRILTKIKFFDVWHGIPYKGFTDQSFKHLHGYTETWVSSKLLKKMYVERFGFKKEQVAVTGYARVDDLVNEAYDKKEIIDRYKIERANKYILIAPTWKQDDKGRSILPFGVEESKFFSEIDEIAKKNKAIVIFRSHLNSNDDVDCSNLSNTIFMPYSKYEIAEEFLFIADLLVTDWSSIAFDYLPLQRPTVFLDVPAPFKNGFSLGPEYRFGEVVDSFSSLKVAISEYISDPDKFKNKHGSKMRDITQKVYDGTLDGKSAERYRERLDKALT